MCRSSPLKLSKTGGRTAGRTKGTTAGKPSASHNKSVWCVDKSNI